MGVSCQKLSPCQLHRRFMSVPTLSYSCFIQ
nr:MAG TPA: hypothetical protein [Caudoviricetes sp.]